MNDLDILDNNEEKKLPTPKNKRKKSTEEIYIVDEEEKLWKIDENGEGEETEQEIAYERKAYKNEFDVPYYDTGFSGYLTEKEYSMETGQHIKNDCAPKRTCFNCLGDHNINTCTEKKDFQAIARNKKSILGKKSSNIRYHEEGENKFYNLKPGEISKNLRNALQIHDSEAPEFIYRMRILGYPPGWLKEAEVKRAEVTLIDGSGKRMIHPDEEEGETDVSVVKYLPDKLISFPGFNAPFPNHIRDESQYLDYPPIQEHHSKNKFLAFMNMNKVTKYKRKKLKPQETPVTESKLHGDMEVENLESEDSQIEFNPPLPEENSERPPEPPPLTPPSIEVREEGEVSEDSLGNDFDQKENTNTSDKEEGTKTDSIMSEDSCFGHSDNSGKNVESSQQNVDSAKSKIKRHHRSSSKGFTLGVCIPGSENVYNDLPESCKWSVNVSDHILFENLPDALGTWQKMKGIVKGVQTALEKLKDQE